MAVVAVTNIFHGRVSYVPGEIIEKLTEKEERRLIKLKYARPVLIGATPPKPAGQKR
jgi:hypothetical protein